MTIKEGLVASEQSLATIKESLTQLRRVLRHLVDQMQKTILTTQHRKTPTTPEKNLLYRTTLSIPNYTKLHQTSRHYTKVDLLQLLQQTTPNCTYYIKLHSLHHTTPNYIYYTEPHQTTPTTPAFTNYTYYTKLHLLHQHSPTTLTTPN